MSSLNMIKNNVGNYIDMNEEGIPYYPPSFYPNQMRVQNANIQENMMVVATYPSHPLQQKGTHEVQTQFFPCYSFLLGYTPPIEEYHEHAQALFTTTHVKVTMPQESIHEPFHMPIYAHKNANHMSLTKWRFWKKG